MIIINNIDSRYFTLDGIKFAKIYQPLAQGSQAIGIYSIYDTKQRIQNSTKYDEFRIDGNEYNNQEDTIAAILAVTWSGVTDYDVEQLEGRIENLEENQYSGVIVYPTLADLPNPGTLLVSYKVSNDPTPANNGYYHWDGAAYVKDAPLLVLGDIVEGNQEAVSGEKIYEEFVKRENYKQSKFIKTIVDESTFKTGIDTEDGRNLFVDLYLEGFDTNGKYYGASIINGASKNFTIYEVDASGKFIDAGAALATVTNIVEEKNNLVRMSFDNGTYKVEAVIDWQRITGNFSALDSIRFTDEVYLPHYGMLTDWDEIKESDFARKTADNTAEIVKVKEATVEEELSFVLGYSLINWNIWSANAIYFYNSLAVRYIAKEASSFKYVHIPINRDVNNVTGNEYFTDGIDVNIWKNGELIKSHLITIAELRRFNEDVPQNELWYSVLLDEEVSVVATDDLTVAYKCRGASDVMGIVYQSLTGQSGQPWENGYFGHPSSIDDYDNLQITSDPTNNNIFMALLFGNLEYSNNTSKTTAIQSELDEQVKYNEFSAWGNPTSFAIDDANEGFNFVGKSGGSSGAGCELFQPDGDKLVFIKFDAELNGVAEAVRVYLYNAATLPYTSILQVQEGANEISFDPAFYDVYFGTMEFEIIISVSNTTNSNTINLKNFKVFQNKLYQEGVHDENLELILEKITAKASSQSGAEGSINYEFDPDGNKYIMQLNALLEYKAIPVFPDEVLYVGNSLLLGHETFGMAALDSQHDYYYYLSQLIAANVTGYSDNKLSGTSFEGATTEAAQTTWLNNTLLPYLNSDLRLVLVQLGDNVNTPEKRAVWKQGVKDFLSFVRNNAVNTRVVWCGSWYGSESRQLAIEACEETGHQFISFEDLAISGNNGAIGQVVTYDTQAVREMFYDSYSDNSVDKELTIDFTVNAVQYQSVIEYDSYVDDAGQMKLTITGYQKAITTSGVASHPGNSGMLAIANRLAFDLGLIENDGDIV